MFSLNSTNLESFKHRKVKTLKKHVRSRNLQVYLCPY